MRASRPGLKWPCTRYVLVAFLFAALFVAHLRLSPSRLDYGAASPYYNPSGSNMTIDLVIASMRKDDISWTSKLHIPNLRVIRYVSDDPRATHRPPVPRKGREATIYHTYFHDYYDDLPDLAIMIHAHEDPWHMDGVLQQSMLFALSRLDLAQVRRRRYANLRVSWREACPDWINTTKTPDESWKQEEPFMREAFQSNFGAGAQVPEILAAPCCSQFAVAREAIRMHPKEQYARSLKFLLDTSWSDYIVGRTWEHLFQWLFKAEATDCPVEWRTYCGMYGVCFEDHNMPKKYNDLWKERHDLEEYTEWDKEIVNPQAGVRARRRMAEITGILRDYLRPALQRGMDEGIRREALGDLYSP